MITNGIFWCVVAVSVVVYWLLSRPRRDLFLTLIFAGYIAFLDWQQGGVKGLLTGSAVALFGFCCLAYVSMQTLEGRYKWLTFAAGGSVLLYLAFYKYLPPLLHPELMQPVVPRPGERGAATAAGHALVVVPLGASYFTFKIVHYVIECHRKHIGKHSFSTFLAYMFFLPMYMAGPIERFDEFMKNRDDTLRFEYFWRGGTRIIYGLVKKFIIVDMFLTRQAAHGPTGLLDAIPLVQPAQPLDRVMQHLNDLPAIYGWQFVINHFITWYVDFSAYSDIAIGLGLFYGITLCENFEWPFLVSNIADFWKRYHMSLSNWAQRYVYFPILGSTRNAQLALFATMVGIGLWHAGNINYLAWGAYQAALLMLHLVWARYKRRRIGREEDDGPFARLTENPAFLFLGGVITFLGICASSALPSTQTYGIRAGVRLLGVLVGIHLRS